MKRYFTTVLLLLTVLLNGCINEDWSLCKIDNCILKFDFENMNPGEEFADRIGCVDVFIFDSENKFVQHTVVDEASLRSFAGVGLELRPGEYRVVCLGNITGGSKLSAHAFGDHFDNSRIETTSTVSCDPIYYAPLIANCGPKGLTPVTDYTVYSIDVPKNGVVEKTYTFFRIHRGIHVYVKGFGAAVSPHVEVGPLPTKAAFNLALDTDTAPFGDQCTTTTIGSDDFEVAKIYSLPFDDPSTIDIRLLDMTTRVTEICAPINLGDYLTANPSADLDDIEIMLEFDNGNVTVSFPNWEDNNVSPI